MTQDELYQTMMEKSQTWFTSSELASTTQNSPSEVEKLLNGSELFVRSSAKSPTGEKLFSTRKEFRKKAPFLSKLVGAFKNRID